MADTYAGAYLTIAASSSKNDSSGCFPQRVNTKYIPPDYKGYYPIERDPTHIVTVSTSFHGRQSRLYMLPEWMESSSKKETKKYEIGTVNSSYDPAEEEHLASRAWTLQERLMSPRVIHYGADQMFWECRQEYVSEDGARFPATYFKLSELINGEIGSSSTRHLTGWPLLIESYCGRNLTCERDKLPALSGIAHYVAKHTKDTYYAGLWKQHLWEDLYWRVGSPESMQLLAEGGWCRTHFPGDNESPVACETEIGPFIPSINRPRLPDAKTWVQGISFPQLNRAPSWSFASLNGQIAFEKIMVDRVVTQFIRCTVDLVGNDPFGEVRGGTLFLRVSEIYMERDCSNTETDDKPQKAPVIPVTVGGEARKEKRRTSTTASESKAIFVGYDRSEHQVLVQLSTAKGAYKGTAIFDAGIKYPSLALFIDWEHALIIEPTAIMESSGSEDNFFRRIGIAEFRHPFENKSAPAFLATMEHIRTVAII